MEGTFDIIIEFGIIQTRLANGNPNYLDLICDVLSQCLEIETPHWNGQNLINREESRNLYLQSLRHADKTGSLGPLIEYMWG